MKQFFIWFKSKSGIAYLVLFAGFVLTTLVNTNFVSEQATKSVSQLINQQTEYQAKTTFAQIHRFLDNRQKLASELASSPIVVSAIMGHDGNSANLADFLTSKLILGQQERITVADFEGKVIYPIANIGQTLPTWAQRLETEQLSSVTNLVQIGNDHVFQLAVPIHYNGFQEGTVLLDLIANPIESLLKAVIWDDIYRVAFKDSQGNEFATGQQAGFAKVAGNYHREFQLNIDFFVSEQYISNEKNNYINQIGKTLVVGMVVSFVLLAILIRSILISPLQNLAESRRKIRESEVRYQLAIQGSNDGIWDWDIAEDIVYLSPRLKQQLNLTDDKKDFISMNSIFSHYVHPEDKARNRQALRQHFKNNKPYDCEHRMLMSDGSYRHFRVRGLAQRDEQGKPIRMAGSLTDIHEFKRQKIELEKALNEAKQASRAKTEFLANMSHEIRTPMNGVLGSLQVLKRQKLPASAQQLIETGIISSTSLLSIINDILDLSKIEANNISLESLPTDIPGLLNTIRSELALAAVTKELEFTVNTANLSQDMWVVDPVRVKQIITNLCSNAIKFTGSGEVKIIASDLDGQLSIAVTDTGIGLSESQKEKLFKRFEQADSSTTRKYGGTGLGLAISKRLANLMKGDIQVESEENVGSTFTLTVPAEKSSMEKATAAKASFTDAPDLYGQTILLAEDNKINQTIFCSIVEPTNANVIVANDGVEAVIEVNKSVPKIVFMDIQMPNMDGVEACNKIREKFPDLPIIALTANVMSDDVKSYMKSGFNGHLAKPIDISTLYQTISEYCDISKIK